MQARGYTPLHLAVKVGNAYAISFMHEQHHRVAEAMGYDPKEAWKLYLHKRDTKVVFQFQF